MLETGLRGSRSRGVFGSLCERVREFRHTPDDTAHERVNLLGRIVQRTEASHSVRIVEVPGVFRQPHEIADGGIGSPGATKCRAAQLLRNALAQEGRDVGSSINRFNRGQVRQIRLQGSRRGRGTALSRGSF